MPTVTASAVPAEPRALEPLFDALDGLPPAPRAAVDLYPEDDEDDEEFEDCDLDLDVAGGDALYGDEELDDDEFLQVAEEEFEDERPGVRRDLDGGDGDDDDDYDDDDEDDDGDDEDDEDEGGD